MQRERLGSRLGFILLSAGCAIGIGNVWKFPYMVGQNGGGAFVLIYLFFLLVLGIPVMTIEFSLGRASQKSPVRLYQQLEPKGSKWHYHGYVALSGNYLLMMFYTMVAGWMMYYGYVMATGKLSGASSDEVSGFFSNLMTSTGTMTGWMIVAVLLAFGVCSLGLQNGIERITKVMMVCLLTIMVVLCVKSCTLPGAIEGIKFYLLPDFGRLKENGLLSGIYAAMGQAFFTLSLGIGAMAIFGSYIGKERRLTGEAISITVLDTVVAFVAGLIIFPSCFAFDVNPGQGPGLVFVTLPNVFREMAGGRIWGALFFLFMSFAAFSTIIAVFQNIIQFARDMWGISLKKSVLINGVLLILLAVPCVLGMTDWAGFSIGGKSIMDIEDFLVSNNLLPIGSLVYLLFCMTRYGWGWDNFIKEANTGSGVKFPTHKAIRFYLTFILPLIVLFIFVQGYWGLIAG